MACEVAFMGGPADGQQHVLPEDEPPGEFIVQTKAAWDAEPESFTYVRQVSQMDYGPLWVFVPAGG